MKYHAILLTVLLLATSSLATDIVVIKPGDAKSAIDISGLTTSGGENAGVFKAVLASDLKRSGWFNVVQGGTIVVTGSCAVDSSAIRARCDVKSPSQGQRYLSQSYEEAPARAAALAHKVADDIVMAVKKVPGIASTRIAMIGSRGGKKDLYVCDYDGRNMMQVTHEGAICISPNWFPDGNRIAYTSFFQQNRPIIYMIDLAGKARSVLSGFPGLNTGASISRDGRNMAMTLSKDGNAELYVMTVGGGAKNLTRLTASRATEASPTWSLDGGKIAYVSDKGGSPQIYIKDRNGGPEARVSLIGQENVAPDWGPNGKLAWTTRREGRYQISVLDKGKEEVLDTTRDGFDYEDPSWAPDGRHIVCGRTSGFHSDVYILDTMGDPPIRITVKEGEWYSPVWSPK